MLGAPSTRILSSMWKAFLQLNPNKVKTDSERKVCLAVVGPEAIVRDVTELLVGPVPEDYERAADTLLLVPSPVTDDSLKALRQCDIVLCSTEVTQELTGVDNERRFAFESPPEIKQVIENILHVPFLGYTHLPLARALPGIRPIVSTMTIQNISVENAIFVVSTSLGNVIPNPLQPLASVAEAAGDLVVLTANQFRMLFQLAAAHNRPLGLRQLSPEIASILGAAFGWRSIARELAGQIPLGGGVIPKAAIAFAGTWAVGDGIAYYYSTGRRLTKTEIKQRFDAAYQKGRSTAESILGKLRNAYIRFNPSAEHPQGWKSRAGNEEE